MSDLSHEAWLAVFLGSNAETPSGGAVIPHTRFQCLAGRGSLAATPSNVVRIPLPQSIVGELDELES